MNYLRFSELNVVLIINYIQNALLYFLDHRFMAANYTHE